MTDFFINPIDLTQKLIRCKSVTPANDGALEIVEQTLKQAGFETTRLTFEGNGGSYAVDNIYAKIGSGAPHICFMGHTDVVPVGELTAWKKEPFGAEIEDGILYGRGAADMKTGVATSIAAAIQYVRNYPVCGTISFIITGDEEAESINGTARVVEWLREKNNLPTHALVCEPSNPSVMGELIRTGRRGSYNAELNVRGKQGHSAYPNLFINPIDRMLTLLTLLRDFEWDKGNDQMPPTHLALTSVDVGNETRNTVPALATAKFNIRFNNFWNSKTITQKIHEILGSSNIPYELSYVCNAESFLTKPDKLLDNLIEAIQKTSKKTPSLDTGGGTSDARFIAPYCPVVEYGVITKTNHQVDEHMRVADILEATETYLEFLKTYFGCEGK